MEERKTYRLIGAILTFLLIVGLGFLSGILLVVEVIPRDSFLGNTLSSYQWFILTPLLLLFAWFSGAEIGSLCWKIKNRNKNF